MTLSAEIHEMIKTEMAHGDFSSEGEFIKAAVLLMKERRIAHEDIAASFADMDAGRVQTSEAFDREFRARNGIGNRA